MRPAAETRPTMRICVGGGWVVVGYGCGELSWRGSKTDSGAVNPPPGERQRDVK